MVRYAMYAYIAHTSRRPPDTASECQSGRSCCRRISPIDGPAAFDAASSSPKSVSAEMTTRPELRAAASTSSSGGVRRSISRTRTASCPAWPVERALQTAARFARPFHGWQRPDRELGAGAGVGKQSVRSRPDEDRGLRIEVGEVKVIDVRMVGIDNG